MPPTKPNLLDNSPLTLPGRLGWARGLTAAEVAAIVKWNTAARAIVEAGGGVDLWIALTEGGRKPPAEWPFPLPSYYDVFPAARPPAEAAPPEPIRTGPPEPGPGEKLIETPFGPTVVPANASQLDRIEQSINKIFALLGGAF
jgi:hypothetical protein